MSGFEIAGLLLGAFPLAIEGIKAYSSGIKTMKLMKDYKQILREFARELRVEKCKFDNLCLELLSEFVSPKRLKRMIADPGAAEWNDTCFKQQLKSRLGPADDTLENWLLIATQLKETLVTVAEKFQLPQNSGKKVQHPAFRIAPQLTKKYHRIGSSPQRNLTPA